MYIKVISLIKIKQEYMASSYIGKVIDNYRIVENLGVGGMGIVFKAIHIKLDKIFALKMIAPGLTMNENFLKRFQTEAKALAKLEDPNIIRIYDLRADEDRWFIVMEFVEGINLLNKIKQDGYFKWQEGLPILKQVLKGIGHAHMAGIIHRDIKPNNIMITRDQIVKITDFGLAKDQGKRITTLSLSSGGTLFYMSPEHVKGISFTDKRSDIYSIGMTFYEMITGSVPLQSFESDFDIREAIMRKDLPKPSVYNPDIPPLLDNIVMKSLAKDPEDRYQNAEAMLDAISNFEEKYPILDLGKDIISKSKTKRKSNKKIHAVKADDGPETRFEFVLNSQSRQLWKEYGPIFAIIVIFLIFVLIYLFAPESGKEEPHKLLQAELNIQSDPPGAFIYIDGDSSGITPLDGYLINPGKHQIRLQKESFAPFDTLIVITADKSNTFSADLKDIPQRFAQSPRKEKNITAAKNAQISTLPGNLNADSEPAGAILWIDGKKSGPTPVQLDHLKHGYHDIRIEKKGYEPYRQRILIKSNTTIRINAKLVLVGGKLEVSTTPSEAIVNIEDYHIHNKITPVTIPNLPSGLYKVQIEKPGFRAISKEVRINQGETSRLLVDLEHLTGNLAIQIRPWGSIYLNNKLLKESSNIRYQIELPVDTYSLKVVHPTLGIWEKNVQVVENNGTNILVDFNREDKIKILAVDEHGAPLNATVYVDNTNTEKITPADITLRTGIHKIKLKMEGFDMVKDNNPVLVDKTGEKIHKFVLKKIK
jgi:serine/threonine-protein kinase